MLSFSWNIWNIQRKYILQHVVLQFPWWGIYIYVNDLMSADYFINVVDIKKISDDTKLHLQIQDIACQNLHSNFMIILLKSPHLISFNIPGHLTWIWGQRK